jgi:hypothetical protein
MTKVFVYRPSSGREDCAAVVYDEEGNVLGAHISSSLEWARHDVARFIPEGAEAVWCIGRAALEARIEAGELRNLSFAEQGDCRGPS